MRINSELPLCILNENNDLNDIDFVLFHLYKKNKDYRDYFLNQRKNHSNRIMIFDNSAYEFSVTGETLDWDEYKDAIIELKPDFYILPDRLMDPVGTVDMCQKFFETYDVEIYYKGGEDISPIIVMQGRSEEDVKEMVKGFVRRKYPYIAFPFHNDYYLDLSLDDDLYWKMVEEFGADNLDARYAIGRVQMIRNLQSELVYFDYIHLLGSHQPWEKGLYENLPIDSIDTGYPVKCAINGIKMGTEIEKPNVIIDEFFDKELDEKTKDLIRYNMGVFKRY